MGSLAALAALLAVRQPAPVETGVPFYMGVGVSGGRNWWKLVATGFWWKLDKLLPILLNFIQFPPQTRRGASPPIFANFPQKGP